MARRKDRYQVRQVTYTKNGITERITWEVLDTQTYLAVRTFKRKAWADAFAKKANEFEEESR